jgi:hypothetical protein
MPRPPSLFRFATHPSLQYTSLDSHRELETEQDV